MPTQGNGLLGFGALSGGALSDVPFPVPSISGSCSLYSHQDAYSSISAAGLLGQFAPAGLRDSLTTPCATSLNGASSTSLQSAFAGSWNTQVDASVVSVLALNAQAGQANATTVAQLALLQALQLQNAYVSSLVFSSPQAPNILSAALSSLLNASLSLTQSAQTSNASLASSLITACNTAQVQIAAGGGASSLVGTMQASTHELLRSLAGTAVTTHVVTTSTKDHAALALALRNAGVALFEQEPNYEQALFGSRIASSILGASHNIGLWAASNASSLSFSAYTYDQFNAQSQIPLIIGGAALQQLLFTFDGESWSGYKFIDGNNNRVALESGSLVALLNAGTTVAILSSGGTVVMLEPVLGASNAAN